MKSTITSLNQIAARERSRNNKRRNIEMALYCQERRDKGDTIREIAQDTGFSYSWISSSTVPGAAKPFKLAPKQIDRAAIARRL